MWASWTKCRGLGLAAFLWWGPTAPLASPFRLSSWLVLALRMVADIQPHSGSWPPEPLYLFLQYRGGHQGLSMGLPGLSELLFTCGFLHFSLGGSVLMAGWTSTGGLQFSTSSWLFPFLHCRWSFKEDKMSLVTSHTHLGLYGGGPGNLFSMYTWWKSPLFLPWRSSTLQAGWRVHLPWGPALGHHASNHGKLTSLLPSTQIQQHVQTSFGGWMGGMVPWHPTGGTHPGIALHLGNILPPGWTALLPLPVP